MAGKAGPPPPPPPRDVGAPERREATPVSYASGDADELRLLIVDDDPLMTDLLPRKLQRAMSPRVRILTASNPGEASQIIESMRPDIVLSDFNLRDDRNGIDVLEEAASRAPQCARILFSGHTRREIGAALATAAIHAYVEKPMRLDDLVAALLSTVRDTTGIDLARPGGSNAGR